MLLGVAALGACSGLKESPASLDLPDGSVPPDTRDATPDAPSSDPLDGDASGTSDAGDAASTDSPNDTPCSLATDAWSQTSKPTTGCSDRRVFLLESWTGPASPFFARSVSIARSKTGRVGLAVNAVTGPEEGSLRIRTFQPTSPTFTNTLTTLDTPVFENVGAAVRLASGNDDTFHLVYQRDLSEGGGPVVYRRLPTNNVLTPEQQVVSLGHNTRLDIAVSKPTSAVVVTYYTPPTVAEPGKLESVIRPDATQTFGVPAVIQGSFSKDGVVGNGQHSLAIDSTGAVRVVYNLSQSPSSSNPKYSELAGGLWRQPKTVDNATLSGITGYSVGLVLVGQKKLVAYYERKSGATTAELKIASWTVENDFPDYDVRDLGILAPDPTSPQYTMAFAVDGYGLLHLVHARPTSATRCSLMYTRQARKAGVVRWFTDGLADNLPCQDPTGIVLSMAVDDKGRPHVGYAVAGAGVYYATRFDR